MAYRSACMHCPANILFDRNLFYNANAITYMISNEKLPNPLMND